MEITEVTQIFFYADGSWWQTLYYQSEHLPQWKEVLKAEAERKHPYDLAYTLIAKRGDSTYYYHQNRR
ncbi:hypothetical protein QQ054_10775 [Oscillatoria amoena NRMC-F 0135]|nr:hypothetical protein [Oscillatoria amoena NRMC-F 0135]